MTAIDRAITLIEEAAQELKRGHTLPPDYTDWTGNEDVKAVHDESLEIVAGLRALRAELEAKNAALENVRLLAARYRNEDWACHMLRFVEQAGITASPLRSPVPSAPEQRLQCWDANDPEHGSLDPSDLASNFADNMNNDEAHVFDVYVSIPLPDRQMRVTLTGGEERELHWEWVVDSEDVHA